MAGAAAMLLAGCGAVSSASERTGVAPSRTGPTSPAPSASPSPATPAPGASATPRPTAPGRGEGALTVLAGRGYAEYGASDSAVNWVGEFERGSGCKVNLRYPQPGTDGMDKLVSQGAFDVVSAPPEVAGRLIAERKAAPLTTSLLPYYQQIPEWLRDQRAFTSGGKVYGVPYLWGYHLTLYDAGALSRAPQDAPYSDRGPVMLRDSPMSIADAALVLKKRRPALGVEDPFQLTRQQFDAAVSLLAEKKDAGRSYWTNPVEAVQGFTGGGVRVERALPYTLAVAGGAGRQVKAVDERGTTTGWVDSWMISAQAAAPNCAYRWIDWVSSAKPQQQAAAWNGLAPANPRACSYDPKGTAGQAARAALAARVCDAYGVDDDARIAKIDFAVRPSKDCGGRDGECTDYADWAAAWQRLVG
ncbi:extracellular solute-binding protein [Sphaerisporangium album]|uniref:Extracellular solute-binding protein n=1 Tax=Sphaerisporangium album TaxID=509200 RepID=A0A367FPU6_9ACTN|nr:extracellular solute-binding protein [Sphaerisporangium album]